MPDIKEVIKEYVESITYQSRSNFNFKYSVEQIGDDGYEVYIISPIAEISYVFEGVRDEPDDDPRDAEYGPYYSAHIYLDSCKISGFEADYNTVYYVDELRRYMEQCEMVERILDRIDTYLDDTRTIFSAS